MRDVKKDILIRVYLVYIGILFFGLAVIGKAIYIQTIEGKELLEKAKEQEMKLFDVEAIRGNICADDGTLLATSIPIFDIRMDVSSELITDEMFSEEVDSLSFKLSDLFHNKKASEYRDQLWEARRNGERFMLIQRNITYPELRQLRRFPIFSLGKYKGGLIVISHYRRELPFKNLAKRTIGFENEEAAVKSYVGLEGYFSKHLQGTDGQRLMRRVGNGAWIPVDIENLVEPQNGEDIITSIDINLQDLAESALQKELVNDSADHGCVVVMETKTGYIKAIANVGKFSGTYDEVYNYAVGESTEPGSTFKLASFLVGMEDGKIDLDQLVNCGTGEYTLHGATIKDSHMGTGTITARQVFERSSNVGTSKLIYAGYSDDPQKYIDGLYRLGINKPLNLQIGGEGKPYIKNTNDKFWSALSLPFMAFGYEVSLTPMQLLALYNAVANNGKMVRPLFVKEIRKNGQVVQSFPPEIIKASITSPETLLKAKSLLEGVVDHGTAVKIKNPLYQIAGKTGTAQLAQNNKGYNKGTKAVKYKGSFVGYFPAENPQYTIIVVINNPTKGKYYGGAIAAPVFKEIADHIYAYLQNVKNPPPRDTSHALIPFAYAGSRKDIEEVYSFFKIPVKPLNNAVAWAIPAMDSLSIKLYPASVYSGIMPNVTGMGIKDAVFLLEQLGLKVIVNGKGTVIRQSIEPGRYFKKGSIVVIDLSIQQEAKKLG